MAKYREVAEVRGDRRDGGHGEMRGIFEVKDSETVRSVVKITCRFLRDQEFLVLSTNNRCCANGCGCFRMFGAAFGTNIAGSFEYIGGSKSAIEMVGGGAGVFMLLFLQME